MGCIKSKEVVSEEMSCRKAEHVARNEVNMQELVEIQTNIDFNKQTSYWNIVHHKSNINLNNDKTIAVIKKLGI